MKTPKASLTIFVLTCVYIWSCIAVFSQQQSHGQATSSQDAALLERPIQHFWKDDKDSFSACLLVMDDNHFLIEWLAFHYHGLPLRRLIIAVDPKSRTSPRHVLQRWSGNNSTMIITEWRDADFMSNEEIKVAQDYVRRYFGPNITESLVVHRARQRLFYYKCMCTLKREERSWVLLSDSDEFLYVNYPTVNRLGIPLAEPISQPGSVLTFLKRELARPGNNLSTPCVQIPRIRFGAQESSVLDQSKLVPDTFNASSFQTLRWRHHATQDNYYMNRISKVLIDLARVSWDDLQPVDSIHRPIRNICTRRRLHIRRKDQVFVMNHYLGTREQYFYRQQDARAGNERSTKVYEKTARVAAETDDYVRPWLGGFVHSVGEERAKYLLNRVGELH